MSEPLTENPQPAEKTGRELKRFVRWLLAGFGVLVVLLLAVTFVWAFGKPVAPSASTLAAASASEATSATDDAAAQAVPAADPGSPFAVSIPGCVCHSKDPKVVKEHANYRMNQCAGCHKGGVPTGQK